MAVNCNVGKSCIMDMTNKHVGLCLQLVNFTNEININLNQLTYIFFQLSTHSKHIFLKNKNLTHTPSKLEPE